MYELSWAQLSSARLVLARPGPMFYIPFLLATKSAHIHTTAKTTDTAEATMAVAKLFDAIILNWILLINNTRHLVMGVSCLTLIFVHLFAFIRITSHTPLCHHPFRFCSLACLPARSLARSPARPFACSLARSIHISISLLLLRFPSIRWALFILAKNNSFVSIFFILLSWTLVCITHRAYYSQMTTL